MSFNEKPGMYVFEKKNFSEQGSAFDAGLALSQDFLLIVTKKNYAFFSIWEYFCQKIWDSMRTLVSSIWKQKNIVNSQWKQGSVFDAGLDLLKAPKVESAPIYVGYKSDAYIGITHAIAANSNYCRNKGNLLRGIVNLSVAALICYLP